MHPDFGYFEETKLDKSYDFRLLRRLYPFLRPYRLLLFWSVVLVLFITVLDLALPYVTKLAIDRYIVPRAEQTATTTPRTEPQQRMLAVELSDPQIRAVVRKYNHLFKTEEQTAVIPYDSLARLDKADVAVLRKKDLAGLGRITVVFMALVILNFAFNFAQKMIMEYTGHMIMHDLRMCLFTHIQNLALDFFTRHPVARLVTRTTNDVQNMNELFTSVIALVFKDLFLLFGIAVVMLILNWKLALVSFTVLPFALWASLNFAKRAREIFRELRIKIAEINARFAETIGGIRIIQLFCQEVHNYQRFKQLNHANYLAGMRQIHVLAVFMPLIEFLGIVAVALVVYYGGGRVVAGTLSLGSLVVFISYIRMFFSPIRDLAEKYNIIQNAMASAERIFLILDNRNHLPRPLSGPRQGATGLDEIHEIRLEKVDFSYVGDEVVLKSVSFALKAGETVGIVGPTGAGKSSIINLITRFYDPTSGRVLINGRDAKNFDPAAFRSKMALVTQDPFLFTGTVRENIFGEADPISENEARTVIEAANCAELIQRLPMGLDTMLAEGGSSISSGERQLISIARAIARSPQVILFDEATSYIDSQTELRIQQALEKLMQTRTSLVVAHRLSTVRDADRIFVLNRGRIIESGTHAELMNRRGFYYRLHQLQNSAEQLVRN